MRRYVVGEVVKFEVLRCGLSLVGESSRAQWWSFEVEVCLLNSFARCIGRVYQSFPRNGLIRGLNIWVLHTAEEFELEGVTNHNTSSRLLTPFLLFGEVHFVGWLVILHNPTTHWVDSLFVFGFDPGHITRLLATRGFLEMLFIGYGRMHLSPHLLGTTHGDTFLLYW